MASPRSPEPLDESSRGPSSGKRHIQARRQANRSPTTPDLIKVVNERCAVILDLVAQEYNEDLEECRSAGREPTSEYLTWAHEQSFLLMHWGNDMGVAVYRFLFDADGQPAVLNETHPAILDIQGLEAGENLLSGAVISEGIRCVLDGLETLGSKLARYLDRRRKPIKTRTAPYATRDDPIHEENMRRGIALCIRRLRHALFEAKKLLLFHHVPGYTADMFVVPEEEEDDEGSGRIDMEAELLHARRHFWEHVVVPGESDAGLGHGEPLSFPYESGPSTGRIDGDGSETSEDNLPDDIWGVHLEDS